MVKNLPSSVGHGLDPWVGKIPWRRKWLPTPVFLPREFHRQRSLAGYSAWGCKELDMTELSRRNCGVGSSSEEVYGNSALSTQFCCEPEAALYVKLT